MNTVTMEDVENKSLACKALRIVLQHWMIPDLGWHTDSLDKKQEIIRENFLRSFASLQVADPENCEGFEQILQLEQVYQPNNELLINFIRKEIIFKHEYITRGIHLSDEVRLIQFIFHLQRFI